MKRGAFIAPLFLSKLNNSMAKEQDLNKYSVRPTAIRYLLGYLVLFLGSVFAKIKIKGGENVPKKGPFIVVCNHFNRLDPPFVIFAIKKPINFLMATDQTVEAQFMWAPWLYGFIPANRQNIVPTTIKSSLAAIKKGEVVGIFPEGTATEHFIRPAKNGAAYLAMRTGVQILPMSLIGMDNIWTNWLRGLRPKLQINIGKPFLPKSLPRDRTERNTAINITGEEIMCRIAALVPDEYHGVYSGDERINNFRSNVL
jgi:1-acyl-sn-glycerol-3-phosphate acyltransferase